MTNAPLLVLPMAALLDFLLGDPWGWPHPVRVMGWLIQRYTQVVFGLSKLGWLQHHQLLWERGAGVVATLGLMGGSGAVGWGLVYGCGQLHPWLGQIVAVIMLASCFAGRSLRAAAEDVLQPLTRGDLPRARSRLALYVGRDTEALSEPEILRAVLETVTENATDGVMAPLFYALLGLCLPGIGSLPLCLGYKAASTLDSMVGYRTAPYTHLGWFPARLEDLLTWLPCRLTVLTLALYSGRPSYVWWLCCRDAPQDPSPNAGWSECAYAAILGVQLGGLNFYRGVAKPKPLLAEPLEPITATKVRAALGLTRRIFLLWLGLTWLGLTVVAVIVGQLTD